jgi:hypothetical protein
MNRHAPLLALFLSFQWAFSQSPAPSESPSPSAAPSASAEPSTYPSASPLPSICNLASWSPESHTFYGRKETIIEKLANLSSPSDHRVFIQVTQGDSSGNVRLYEKNNGGGYTVTEWSTPKTSQLLDEIDRAIVANKGVNCVGEQVKGVLNKLGKGARHENVAAPESAKAAFAHPVKEAQGEFVKTTIILNC